MSKIICYYTTNRQKLTRNSTDKIKQISVKIADKFGQKNIKKMHFFVNIEQQLRDIELLRKDLSETKK